MKYFLTLLIFVFACGPGNKGTRLQELERMLADPDASLVKDAPGGKKIYQEARQYRRLSLEAWEEGKESRSEEYALLGWLKYRTADALLEQYRSKARLENANAKVAELNPELTAVNNEQLKLNDEITRLENRFAILKRQEEQRTHQNKSMTAFTEKQKAGKESLSEFNRILREVEAAKNTADKVNAKTHATGLYTKAENIRKSLHAAVKANNSISTDMMRRVKYAKVYFENAAKESATAYKVEVEKQDPVKRQRNLVNSLTKVFGNSRIEVTAGSIRLIFNTSFQSSQSNVNVLLSKQLDQLLPIAKRFDEFNLLIEGYTEKGDPTDNLGLSQLRAMNVRNALSKKGILKSRIRASGRGQDNLRFSTSIENNRIEIIFHH